MFLYFFTVSTKEVLDSFNIIHAFINISRKKKRKTNMSDSQRTEEERTHTKILKTERELFFRNEISASIKF